MCGHVSLWLYRVLFALGPQFCFDACLNTPHYLHFPNLVIPQVRIPVTLGMSGQEVRLLAFSSVGGLLIDSH